jgi:hypothetical protein
LLYLSNVVGSCWFLLLGQKLRIDFLSLSVSSVDVNVFLFFGMEIELSN